MEFHYDEAKVPSYSLPDPLTRADGTPVANAAAWPPCRLEISSALHAHPVYGLLGTDGLPVSEMPPVHQSAQGTIGYPIRAGKHGIIEYDWEQYLDFADRHFS